MGWGHKDVVATLGYVADNGGAVDAFGVPAPLAKHPCAHEMTQAAFAVAMLLLVVAWTPPWSVAVKAGPVAAVNMGATQSATQRAARPATLPAIQPSNQPSNQHVNLPATSIATRAATELADPPVAALALEPETGPETEPETGIETGQHAACHGRRVAVHFRFWRHPCCQCCCSMMMTLGRAVSAW